jgi:uncharacterized membrane protein
MVLVAELMNLREPSVFWGSVAHTNVIAALAWGAVAGVLGFVDYLAIPGGTRASRVGLARAFTNVGVLGALAMNLATSRLNRPDALRLWPLACAALALVLLLVSTWLGSVLRVRGLDAARRRG